MIKNCMVIGGAGFIGHHVAKKLSDFGHRVYIIDNLSTGNMENVDHVRPYDFFNTDITDYKALDEDFKYVSNEGNHIDWVFHLAALPRVQFSIANPIESHNANINGTLNVLELSQCYLVEKVVFSSSSSVYGDQESLPLKETMEPNPMSPYASQKLYGEILAKQYNMHYGLNVTALRYFNVYGPRQRADSSYAAFIPKFIESYLNNERPTVFGDGEQTRDFTYVDDVVNANILAAERATGFSVANIGAGNNQSVNEVDSMIREHIKPSVDGPIYGDPVIEPKNTLAANIYARTLMGWKPQTNISDGLRNTIESFSHSV